MASPAPSASASALSGSAASASASDAREAHGWVTGIVVDAAGEPVAGDLVNALSAREVPEAGVIATRSDRRTRTDAHGRFRVRQAAAGYLVQICDPDPSSPKTCRETGLGVEHLITYVGPGRHVTDSWVPQTALYASTAVTRHLGQITVKPQSYVHGRVRHANTMVLDIDRLNGSVAYRAETDAKGNYHISGLAPGRYRMSNAEDAEGWLVWRSGVFRLHANHDRAVNGVLRRGATVHGVISSAAGPAAVVDVLLRNPDGDFVAATTTDDSGRYRISGQRPGAYRVGILYNGSAYQRHGVAVSLSRRSSSVRRDIRVRRGAVVTIAVRDAGKPARGLVDELRDAGGHPIGGKTDDGAGHVRYTGLSPGTYHFYGAVGDRYATTTINVGSVKRYDLGRVRLSHPTLTLTGTTAPKAVIVASTADQCPLDAPAKPGSFLSIEKADAAGHYTITGLVPGSYMLRAGGWPANYLPRCLTSVAIRHDRGKDLPLRAGATVAGRLVYASTGGPVITRLSYELRYPPGSPVQPAPEQPARAKARGASGEFLIDALGRDTVTGRLAQSADLEEINAQEFTVVFPYQDGTPYYLDSRPRTVDVTAGANLDLGDIALFLRR